jgi:hypothetical protein
MVAADSVDRSCEEQQRMIDRVLCISRRTSSLLIPVLSLAGSFCSVIPVLHDLSLCNLLRVAVPHLACRNFRSLGHCLDTRNGDVPPPRTIGSEEAARNAPGCDQNADSCSTVYALSGIYKLRVL